jgi:hypothetical protein
MSYQRNGIYRPRRHVLSSWTGFSLKDKFVRVLTHHAMRSMRSGHKAKHILNSILGAVECYASRSSRFTAVKITSWVHWIGGYWWTDKNQVGIEVLTAVVMKSSIFWDITPCSPLKVNQCFGGTSRLYLQVRRIGPQNIELFYRRTKTEFPRQCLVQTHRGSTWYFLNTFTEFEV